MYINIDLNLYNVYLYITILNIAQNSLYSKVWTTRSVTGIYEDNMFV